MNILAFFAHPDDETMLNGGTLALLSRKGAHIHYLCATRGEGGETGEPPLCSQDELGKVRARELACAVEQLGGASLRLLDYVDPRVGPDEQLFPFTEDLPRLVEELLEVIRVVKAEAVITHGSNGEYGHPAHLLSHQAMRRAVESLGERAPLLYTTVATFPEHPRPRLVNRDDPAHLILDVTAALEEKTQAALCHRTQNALFVRRPSREAGRLMSVPEVILRVESLHRVLPPVNGMLDDEVAGMLAEWNVLPAA
jgi:LmbE family N-acetylglucosaminyl deacetylase